MDNKGYYKILGVNENASQEAIKLSYRKLSLKWHPDRHVSDSEEDKKKAEEEFKKIAEAYSVIGDEEKRKQYDMGIDGGSGEGFDPFSMFRSHFGGFSDFFGGMREEPQQRGSDIVTDVNITFKEAYEGTSKEISFYKEVPCKECNGTGSADGKNNTCPYCHGTGMITQSRQQGNMIFQTSHPCEHCHGTGKVITNACKHCHGTGTEKVKHTERIDIPAGVFDGAQLNMSGKGNAPKGKGINGNLAVRIHVQKDNYFTRPDAINVIHYEEVDIKDALLGCTREVKYPDGSTFKLNIHECTKDNETFMYKNKGFIDVQNPYNGRGDYAIVIKYKYPNKLSNKQKELLKEW